MGEIHYFTDDHPRRVKDKYPDAEEVKRKHGYSAKTCGVLTAIIGMQQNDLEMRDLTIKQLRERIDDLEQQIKKEQE